MDSSSLAPPGDDYKVEWTTTETKSETYSSYFRAICKKISTGGSLSYIRGGIGTKLAGCMVFKRVRKIRHYARYVRLYLFNGWNPPGDESEILVTPKNNYRGAWTTEAIGDPNIKVAIQGGFLKVKPISRRRGRYSGEVRVTPIDKPSWIGEWHEDRTYAVGLSGSRPSPKYWSRYWITTESPAPPTPSENKGTLVVKAVEKENESNIIEDATIKVTQGGSEVFTVEGSGSKDLDPGLYRVSFESKTPSGWKQCVEESFNRRDPQPIAYKIRRWKVKAGETTTVKGYYVKPEKPQKLRSIEVDASQAYGDHLDSSSRTTVTIDAPYLMVAHPNMDVYDVRVIVKSSYDEKLMLDVDPPTDDRLPHVAYVPWVQSAPATYCGGYLNFADGSPDKITWQAWSTNTVHYTWATYPNGIKRVLISGFISVDTTYIGPDDKEPPASYTFTFYLKEPGTGNVYDTATLNVHITE